MSQFVLSFYTWIVSLTSIKLLKCLKVNVCVFVELGAHWFALITPFPRLKKHNVLYFSWLFFSKQTLWYCFLPYWFFKKNLSHLFDNKSVQVNLNKFLLNTRRNKHPLPSFFLPPFYLWGKLLIPCDNVFIYIIFIFFKKKIIWMFLLLCCPWHWALYTQGYGSLYIYINFKNGWMETGNKN